MPAAGLCGTVVSMCCRPWPVSWKSVVTSEKVISDGLPSTGGEPLHVRYATGLRLSTFDEPTQVPIHAPPRLSSGRAYGSR